MATKKTPAPKAPATKAPKAKAAPAAAPAPKAKAAKADGASPLVGKVAPAFTLVGDDGAKVTRASLAGKKVVLFFYPKDDTPGCTREACAFQESLGKLGKKGATVIGVSRDGAASHQRFRTKYGLTFPLLTDADGSVHKAFGAWGMKTLYGRTSEGVIRTTAILDEKGVVVRVFSPVKVDGHADAVLAALG